METSQIELAQQTVNQAATSIESFDHFVAKMEAIKNKKFIPNEDYYEMYIQLAKIKNTTESLVERFRTLQKCIISE